MIRIFQSGGIGDLIIGCAWIEHILRPLGVEVILYTHFQDIASFLLPWVNLNEGDYYYGIQRSSTFSFYINLTDMIDFKIAKGNTIPDFLQPLYQKWLIHSKDFKDFIDKQPFKANEMAHFALTKGIRRWELPFYVCGERYKEFTFFKVKPVSLQDRFITVHDGFDASMHYTVERSMKSWDSDYWKQFVSCFKQKYPDFLVVQLGGVRHRKIEGVDINMAGLLSFEQSLAYLFQSVLHIDNDSGLVHARRLFQKRSLVMFGPTNYEYFAYPENINIKPSFCGDCWWKMANWMQQCREGFNAPKCMDSILPGEVLAHVSLFY